MKAHLWISISAVLMAIRNDAQTANESRDAQEIFDEGMQRNQAGDVSHWLQLARKAAEMGLPEAEAQMGGLYEEGQGFARDHAQAKYWYEKAVSSNNCAATTHLGPMYETGEGVAEDWVKAAELYQRGANRGCVGSEAHLGRCYQYGLGVPQDRRQAITWLKRTAQHGATEAAEVAKLLMDSSINLTFINENELASICRATKPSRLATMWIVI